MHSSLFAPALMAPATAPLASHAQTLKVEVKGDYAVLEARDSPGAVTVQHLAGARDGWKVGVLP